MSRPREPQPVKLISSILGADSQATDTVIELLRNKFGETDYISDALKFDFTDYYEPEMGGGLQRRLISFTKLIMPDELPEIKLETNKLEEDFAGPDGKRSLNLDPGYIDTNKLVLASLKYLAQKIYLGSGIWADPICYYRKGRFHCFEWTFADFKDGRYEKDLLAIRERYKVSLKGRERADG